MIDTVPGSGTELWPTIATNHPEVTTWWYAPNPRFRLRGEVEKNVEAPTPLEVVVETASGDADFPGIAAEVSHQFSNHPVTARTRARTSNACFAC